MTKSSKVITALCFILFTGLISCGKSSKTQTADPKSHDSTKTDPTLTNSGGEPLKITTKKHQRQVGGKSGESEYCDSSNVEINLVEVTYGDKNIQDKINSTIVKSITTKEYTSIDALLHRYDKGEFAMYYVIEMQSLYSDAIILSVQSFTVDQECGFQAESWTTLLNFNLMTGEVIKFTDLIAKENTKKFEKIAGAEFIKKYGKEEYDIKKPEDFKINDKFSISDKGITFYFDKYEVGYGALGDAEILIPYTKFKDLIVKDCIIGNY